MPSKVFTGKVLSVLLGKTLCMCVRSDVFSGKGGRESSSIGQSFQTV